MREERSLVTRPAKEEPFPPTKVGHKSNRLTALGLNNYGKQVYRYGLEDTDVDEKGEFVFREADSTFFCRIRDLFHNELKSMYQTLESKNAWHAESFINQADEWQSEFPEELWRLDIKRKYLRTYTESFINGEPDSQFLVNMANGKMKYQRRQWERSQEKYMASKYQSSVASSDNSVLRCAKPTGNLVVKPNYRLKLTPYAYMYLNVKYGTQSPIQVKAEPNKEYEIPFEGTSADIIDIYSSSLLRSFGDLSTCYAATVDTSKASKIKELIIGNETQGYDNPYLTTLTTGANYLLEKLNVENVSGLTQALDLSALNNLQELYAHGSNIGGVTFADGGRIEIAELPAINALTMKNLIYLATLDVVDWSKLTNMTVENCNTVDLITVLDNATSVNRIRLVGIDWALTEDDIVDNEVVLLNRLYAMKGFDKSGYNTGQSVLTGKITVPIIRQQKLYEYKAAWPDLEIIADTVIEQFPVIFKNADGKVLETQYVDKGSRAVDPTTRIENKLIPTLASTVSHDFTFSNWNVASSNTAFDFNNSIFTEVVLIANYTSTLRRYKIQYVAKGNVLPGYPKEGRYGENIAYSGSTPVYTAEESGYKYYLFNRWDNSGFLDGGFDENGVKTVNAIFDDFTYTATAFNGKHLCDLTPVEIYAMNKLGLAQSIIPEDAASGNNSYTINVGNDVDYDDVESELLIDNKKYVGAGSNNGKSAVFDGTNYIDTGIKLFDVDKDFVIALDYEFNVDTNRTVLAQCYQNNGNVGFKLWYNSGIQFNWSSSAQQSIANLNDREMVIIRHKKGDTNLSVYNSNLNGTSILTYSLDSKEFTSDATLIFGCEKQSSTVFNNYANGKIHWAKIWYKDLGDNACKSLATWIHERIVLEMSGFYRYYLSENPNEMCNFSLLATHLLNRTEMWNNTTTNDGGWAKAALNTKLNNRLYNAMPNQIKSLMKQMIVKSNDGIGTTIPFYTDITDSNCYITIPSLFDVDPSKSAEPYNSETVQGTIASMGTATNRKRAFDGGDYNDYWTRSPYTSTTTSSSTYGNYVWRVEADGDTTGVTGATAKHGVVIEISF